MNHKSTDKTYGDNTADLDANTVTVAITRVSPDETATHTVTLEFECDGIAEATELANRAHTGGMHLFKYYPADWDAGPDD